ncbi:hypothetical protein ACFPRL_10235 [Pseudoclavibacter helvolus]
MVAECRLEVERVWRIRHPCVSSRRRPPCAVNDNGSAHSSSLQRLNCGW